MCWCDHFVKKHSARMGKHVDTISDETMRILENWNWPGNIRELENLDRAHGDLEQGPRAGTRLPPNCRRRSVEASSSLTELEREHIIRILRETNGVLSGTRWSREPSGTQAHHAAIHAETAQYSSCGTIGR